MEFFSGNVDANRPVGRLNFSLDGVPTVDEAKIHIYSIDFSMIKYKLMQYDPNISRVWSADALNMVINYYRNFLFLIRKYSDVMGPLPPSIEIDEIWHHHILDTNKYHEDCQKIFGQYLHHYPYFGMRGEEDKWRLEQSFKTTQDLHFKEFGEYICGFEEEDCEIEIDR